MSRLFVVGSFVLVGGVSIAYCLDKNIITSYYNIANYFMIIVAAFIGVFVSFQLDRYQNNQIEEDTYKSIVLAVGTESANNSSLSKIANKLVKEGKIITHRFNTINVASAINNPIFIKRAETHYYLMLSMYKGTFEHLNRIFELYDSKIIEGKIDSNFRSEVSRLIVYYGELLEKANSMYDKLAKKLKITAQVEPDLKEIYSNPIITEGIE